VRLFYVDDSGNADLTTFTAVAVPVEQWTRSLAEWLAWRRHLLVTYDIDVKRRLHAADWVAGRGRPSDDPQSEINSRKPTRWQEYVAALRAVGAMPRVEVATVALAGDLRKPAYRLLMGWIEELLLAADDWGLVVIDGDNPELRTMHRELDISTRRIVEDPWKRNARESQWPQIADVVAHAAFQSIARNPARAFMWEWYEQQLGAVIVRDPTGRNGVRGLR
jgi:hypothetical protein